MLFNDLVIARRSLRLIFWGVVLEAICIRLGDFDPLNNVIGGVLLAMGAMDMTLLHVGKRDALLLKLIAGVACLNAIMMPFGEGTRETAGWEKAVSIVFGILDAVAAIGFCAVMRRLCESIPLDFAARSWRTSMSYWRVGLPATLGVACYMAWVTTTQVELVRGFYNIPLVPLIPLVILILAMIVAWMHSLVSLNRTVAGLMGLLKQQVDADDVVTHADSFFQFSIRALMIVTAATAVVAAGYSQATVAYWQFTMAGLVGLSLLARLLDHRTLGRCLLIVLGVVLVGGYLLGTHGCSGNGSLCGTNVGVTHSSPEYLLPQSALADIEARLTAEGFQEFQPTAALSDSPSYSRMNLEKPDTTIWYSGTASNRRGIIIRIGYSKNGTDLKFLDMDYAYQKDGFSWEVEQYRRQFEQFKSGFMQWWRGYFDAYQKSRRKP